MRFAICDDERQHIKALTDYFNNRSEYHIETEMFESGEALIEAYDTKGSVFDALFIDMEMGGMNGIETANAIRARDEGVSIVFVTSHEEYAIESFQCNPLRFLKKPLQSEKMDDALHALHRVLTQKRVTFSLYENKNYVRLYCADIIYCEGNRNKMVLYTVDGVHQVHMTFVEVEQFLAPGMFYRCHKGFLVNLGYIKKIVGQDIVLYHCETVLPIGRTYKQGLREAVVDYEERMFH